MQWQVETLLMAAIFKVREIFLTPYIAIMSWSASSKVLVFYLKNKGVPNIVRMGHYQVCQSLFQVIKSLQTSYNYKVVVFVLH